MTKKTSRIIGLIMLIVAIAFVFFALKHPEASFPWSNTVTYAIYAVYLIVVAILLAADTSNQQGIRYYALFRRGD